MSSAPVPPCPLSVCIVSWNCAEMLGECLASIEGEVHDQGYEAIVVDNASDDSSSALVRDRFPWALLIENDSNLGFTKATNQGLTAARGRHRLLLNPDTVVPEGGLRQALEHLEASPDVGVMGCRVEYPDGRFQGSAFRFPDLLSIFLAGLFLPQMFPGSSTLNRERYGNVDAKEARDVDCVMGGFYLIRGEALAQTGLLDESYFMYAEEMDLAMRMHMKGWKVRWFPTPTIQHQRGGTSLGNAEIGAWCYGAKTRGQLFFLDKWRGTGVAWIANMFFLIFLIPRLFGWFFSDLLRGIPPWRSHKLLRGRILRHRLACLFRPSRIREAWRAPAFVRRSSA